MDVKDTMYCIKMAHDRDKCLIVVDTVMSLREFYKVRRVYCPDKGLFIFQRALCSMVLIILIMV